MLNQTRTLEFYSSSGPVPTLSCSRSEAVEDRPRTWLRIIENWQSRDSRPHRRAALMLWSVSAAQPRDRLLYFHILCMDIGAGHVGDSVKCILTLLLDKALVRCLLECCRCLWWVSPGQNSHDLRSHTELRHSEYGQECYSHEMQIP